MAVDYSIADKKCYRVRDCGFNRVRESPCFDVVVRMKMVLDAGIAIVMNDILHKYYDFMIEKNRF